MRALNAIVLCGRVLPPLWSTLARLGVVWLKGVFLVCMNPFRTPYDLIKKMIQKDFLYIYDMLQKTFVE